MLDLTRDPKLVWAIGHPDRFPVDVNRADKETLLRIPGVGVRSVANILRARRWSALRLDDLARMRVPIGKARAFILTVDHRPAVVAQPPAGTVAGVQLSLFG